MEKMDKELFAVGECLGQEVQYDLLKERDERGTYFYGIRVTLREECATVRAITKERNRAEELLSILCGGCVTPVSVRDVVEDWLLA